MSDAPQPAARIVKPRKGCEDKLPLIAVGDDGIILERTGEFLPLDQLPQVILAEQSSIIVGSFMGLRILSLHEAYRDSSTFQYKLTPIRRDSQKPTADGRQRSVLRDTVTTLVGFPGHYHHPIDPQSFIRKEIGEIDKRNLPESVRLLQWGEHVRRFCQDNELKIKPSAGGLAAQLLRDKRFYPEARRKAPRIVNDKVREKLPGNYYELLCGTNWALRKSTYLDMKNAHHTLAQEIAFPCSNSLRAYGFFSSDSKRDWARPGSPRFDKVIKSPGLLHVRLAVPHMTKGTFPPPYMKKKGSFPVWVYSNELTLIGELGGRIEAVYAAIISNDVDTGLSKYAKWALAELDRRKDQRAWLKPTLHSVYGVLAAKPRPLEIGWRIADTKETDLYPMAGRMVPVNVVKTKRAIEPKVINVIHRGMIEAEQRVRTLQLARSLYAQGGQVLCIYADSLFVNMPQLPFLPAPWVVSSELTSLTFHSATHFESDTLIRLPGIPRDRRSVRPVR